MSLAEPMSRSGAVAGTTRMAEEGARAPSYLSVTNLTKRFGKTTVVRDVSFALDHAGFVCVLGPSGCGKTTLLRLIAGFETADGGAIVQGGRDITRLPPEARDYGIVFQSYALFPNRSVAGNVSFGLEATGVARAERARRVGELLSLVGLTEHSSKYPSQLSGGQQQRVALARALALSPGLLLLDEPLSALDANVRAHLRDELRALQQRVGVTTLMVTHDQHEALSIADHLIIMNAGRIEQHGSPFEVFTRPANLFVARFLGDMNALTIEARVGDRVRAAGLDVSLAGALAPDQQGTYLCIRPAEIEIGPAARERDNVFTAHVASTRFLGDAIRVGLVVEGGTRPSLEAAVSRARLGALPRTGDVLDIALPAAHLQVLADAPEAGAAARDAT